MEGEDEGEREVERVGDGDSSCDSSCDDSCVSGRGLKGPDSPADMKGIKGMRWPLDIPPEIISSFLTARLIVSALVKLLLRPCVLRPENKGVLLLIRKHQITRKSHCSHFRTIFP